MQVVQNQWSATMVYQEPPCLRLAIISVTRQTGNAPAPQILTGRVKGRGRRERNKERMQTRFDVHHVSPSNERATASVNEHAFKNVASEKWMPFFWLRYMLRALGCVNPPLCNAT